MQIVWFDWPFSPDINQFSWHPGASQSINSQRFKTDGINVSKTIQHAEFPPQAEGLGGFCSEVVLKCEATHATWRKGQEWIEDWMKRDIDEPFFPQYADSLRG